MAKTKTKEKEKEKGREKEPMRRVSLHEIRKPHQRTIPWLVSSDNKESSTNPIPSTSQPVEEDIYRESPLKDGLYLSK